MPPLVPKIRRARRARLLVSDAVEVPLVAAGWRPTILLPGELCRGGDVAALRYSLAHEWSHVENGDVWRWWLATLAQPSVRNASRAVRARRLGLPARGPGSLVQIGRARIFERGRFHRVQQTRMSSRAPSGARQTRDP